MISIIFQIVFGFVMLWLCMDALSDLFN